MGNLTDKRLQKWCRPPGYGLHGGAGTEGAGPRGELRSIRWGGDGSGISRNDRARACSRRGGAWEDKNVAGLWGWAAMVATITWDCTRGEGLAISIIPSVVHVSRAAAPGADRAGRRYCASLTDCPCARAAAHGFQFTVRGLAGRMLRLPGTSRT